LLFTPCVSRVFAAAARYQGGKGWLKISSDVASSVVGCSYDHEVVAPLSMIVWQTSRLQHASP